MKKNNIIFFSSLVLVYLVATLTISNINGSYAASTPESFVIECIPLDGSGAKIYYNTNGGNVIESSSVCKTCGIREFPALPVPTKNDASFAGWYYDEKFNKRFEGTTTKDVKYLEKYDINGCIIGYEDITLYARWIPNIQCPNEISLTVNFETNGGSKVDKVVLTSRNITNFKLNIPIPTKENYNFNGWYYDIDLKNKVDLSMIFNPDLSKFECRDFEITLYARWVHKKTVTLNGVLKDANSVVMQYYFLNQ